jgi:hypothetical protein
MVWEKPQSEKAQVPALTAKQERGLKIGVAVAFGLWVTAVASCQSTDTAAAGGSSESKLDQATAKVAPDAVSLMTRADFSKTYKKLGKAQFDNANHLTRWAALAAAESEQCPKVDFVAVSDKATRKQIVWYADCSNKERFEITEEQARATRERLDPATKRDAREKADVAALAQPKSARWKDFNEAIAVSACDLLTQQAMLVPRSFSTGWSRWELDKNDETGAVTIERDYKSENAYSMKINGRYRCVIDTDAGDVTALSIREPDGWRKLI